MEDEEKYFYDNELNFFGEESPINPPEIRTESFPWLSQLSSSDKQVSSEQKPGLFRAYNPMDQLKVIPESRHNQYLFFLNNKKTFNGIQHFFHFGQEDQHREQFMQNIQSDAFGDNNNEDFDLNKLFHGEQKQTQKEFIQNTLMALQNKIQGTHQKVMSSLNLNRTISHAFYEHFDNYTLVINSSNFLTEFEQNFKNMALQWKKLKGPGTDLFSSLYQFWMKSFKDLINQIWKHSSKFTLNFFKKNQHQDVDSSNNSSVNQIRSQSSNTNTMGSKEKRKGWTKEETQILKKCIESDLIFTQSVLKNLATQFGRSISSVSSKIQKILKAGKGEETQEDSLFRKTIQILKMQQQGMTRQSIIEKINEHYQMGYGGQWEKSVGQLLSSKKEFIKIRGKHKLLNPHLFRSIAESDEEDRSKLTFKDKVVQILLTLPQYEGDLKTLVDRYCCMFGEGEVDSQRIGEDRKKTIEGNISKTLSRYDIFDNSNSKTKYLLNPLIARVESRTEMQVENFLSI